MESKRICPGCGRELHAKPYLMACDPDRPGFVALLRGEGEDRLMIAVSRLAGLVALFAVANLCLWVLGWG